MPYFILDKIDVSSSFIISPSSLSVNFIVPNEGEIADNQECHPIPMALIRVELLLMDPSEPPTLRRNNFIQNKLTCVFGAFLHYNWEKEYDLTTQKEMEDCVVYAFIASTLLDGWRAGKVLHYIDDNDDDEARKEIQRVTKEMCKPVLNEPGIDRVPFASKLVRSLKYDGEKHFPQSMRLWYREDPSRGNFHFDESRLLLGVLFDAARLVITANLS